MGGWMSNLFKLETTPSGKELFAYMAAILEVTGMMKGDEYPIKKFLGNISTHLEAERIIRSGNGYKLTAKGVDYFMDRFNIANSQCVSRGEVDRMIKGITTGVGAGTWKQLE